MTPQEINVAIAEAYGVDLSPCKLKGLAHAEWLDGSCDCVTERIPNYHGDLNACAEMEKTIIDDPDLEPRYRRFLEVVCGRAAERRFYYATAPQRCEAFLRAIGRWVE